MGIRTEDEINVLRHHIRRPQRDNDYTILVKVIIIFIWIKL